MSLFRAFWGAVSGGGAAVTYLLRQTFTAGNTGLLTNGQTISGPSEGGTYESTDPLDTGVWTWSDTGLGQQDGQILSNSFYVESQYNSPESSLSTSTTVGAGTLFQIDWAFTSGSTVFDLKNSGPGTSYSGSRAAVRFSGGTMVLHRRAGTSIKAAYSISSGEVTTTPLDIDHASCVVGGFTAGGAPSASGGDGLMLFNRRNTTHRLLAVDADCDVSATSFVMLRGDSNTLSGPSPFDNFRQQDTLYPEMFSPAGSVEELSVSGSTTFTHTADCFIMFRVTTIPSSGNIDIAFRTDWGLRVTSGGVVRLMEDIDGSPVQRGQSGNTLVDGEVVSCRADGTEFEIWSDGNGSAERTSSVNQTATAGSVISLGTGGAVSWIKAFPLESATYDAVLTADE